MDFNTYLDQAWSNHATDAAAVADAFNEGLKLVQSIADLEQLGRLAAHVYGEHLGKWSEGILFIDDLCQHPLFSKDSPVGNAFSIFRASLSLCSQPEFAVNNYSVSDQIRILTMSASALNAQGQVEKVKSYFIRALEFGEKINSKEDPANRSLAVTGNNLASSLEEKSNRSDKETELMILAAKTARKFWEVVGTWKELERAEYRLSQSYLQAKMIELSVAHAQNCISICTKNSAPALEFFFGYEALALAEKAKANEQGYKDAIAKLNNYFDQMSSDDKSWCEMTLKKFSN